MSILDGAQEVNTTNSFKELFEVVKKYISDNDPSQKTDLTGELVDGFVKVDYYDTFVKEEFGVDLHFHKQISDKKMLNLISKKRGGRGEFWNAVSMQLDRLMRRQSTQERLLGVE
jgi:hypothetical protein